jgi:GTPase SAR1 family protein
MRYVYGCFPEMYDTTIEDVHKKIIQFRERKYTLEIIDTAGQVSAAGQLQMLISNCMQNEYSLHPKSCTVVDGYVLVYAVGDRRS